jgi:predicted metalloprotease
VTNSTAESRPSDSSGRSPSGSNGGPSQRRGPAHAIHRRPGIFAIGAIVLLVAALIGGIVWVRNSGFPTSGLGRLVTHHILGRLSTAPPADGTDPVTTAASTGDEVQFIRFVVGNVQDTWGHLFQTAHLTYQPTQLVLFQDQIRSACGPATSESGPFYCPADQRVYLDLGFFDEMASRLGAPGDFAQAYVIAHEFGHHVQDLLGITSQVGSMSQAEPQVANDLSVRTELQADCLAGIWGHSAYTQSRLDPGDLDEAVNAAAAVGDDRLQRQAGDRVDPDTFTHGTSAQRVGWFLAGFRSGDPSKCDSFQRDMPAVDVPADQAAAAS